MTRSCLVLYSELSKPPLDRLSVHSCTTTEGYNLRITASVGNSIHGLGLESSSQRPGYASSARRKFRRQMSGGIGKDNSDASMRVSMLGDCPGERYLDQNRGIYKGTEWYQQGRKHFVTRGKQGEQPSGCGSGYKHPIRSQIQK